MPSRCKLRQCEREQPNIVATSWSAKASELGIAIEVDTAAASSAHTGRPPAVPPGVQSTSPLPSRFAGIDCVQFMAKHRYRLTVVKP